jgi:hypothetical protein
MLADNELEELKNDPVSERLRHRMLTEMASGDPDPLRRDLAKDLLSGSVTLTEAARSNVYGRIFDEGLKEFTDWWHGYSAQEREELLATAEAKARAFLESEEGERDGR